MAAYKAGGALAATGDAAVKLTDYKADLPTMCKLIVEQFDAGKLRGARLEVASRVLNAKLGQVEAVLEGNTRKNPPQP